METNTTLYYTDGDQVMITGSSFMVRNTFYELTRITRHQVSIITPPRILSFTLTIIGVIAFICGALNFIPSSWKNDIHFSGVSLQVNSVVMLTGLGVLLLGVLLLNMQEKYAVRILTADGEKNVIVSRSREYIAQIIDALNRAFMDRVIQPRRNSQSISEK